MAGEIAGWIGTFLILVAYVLNIFKLLPVGTIYQLLNLIGAIGLVWLGFSLGAFQLVVLDGIWGAIALASLIRDRAKVATESSEL